MISWLLFFFFLKLHLHFVGDQSYGRDANWWFYLFSAYLNKKLRSIFFEFLVLKLNLVLITSHFMKIIHIELNNKIHTCRTKEDMFECLKYWGSTISSKARKLCILKELGATTSLSVFSCSNFEAFLRLFI